ncbi:MAG: hypothetical protein ACRYGG_11830 [Janthinobacterium lividum]
MNLTDQDIAVAGFGMKHVWNTSAVTELPKESKQYRVLVSWPFDSPSDKLMEVEANWRLDPNNETPTHKGYFEVFLFNDEHQLELRNCLWREV